MADTIVLIGEIAVSAVMTGFLFMGVSVGLDALADRRARSRRRPL